MSKRVAWVVFWLLVILLFVRECVGLLADIEYAKEQYRSLGSFGAMMDFILEPPPGAVLTASVTAAFLFIYLIRQRLSRWMPTGASGKENTQGPVFIRARNTIGTKIIGSIFKGDRTHIDADGSTDLEAAANVHLASGTPQEGQRKQLIPLLDAFAWIAENSGWGEEGFSGAHSEAAALDLRQAALDGEIIIKGRKEINKAYPWERFSKVWEDIPSKYWATHQFDLTVILDETATGQEPETEVEEVNNMSASTMPHYTSLRVQTGQLEARWPKKGG